MRLGCKMIDIRDKKDVEFPDIVSMANLYFSSFKEVCQLQTADWEKVLQDIRRTFDLPMTLAFSAYDAQKPVGFVSAARLCNYLDLGLFSSAVRVARARSKFTDQQTSDNHIEFDGALYNLEDVLSYTKGSGFTRKADPQYSLAFPSSPSTIENVSMSDMMKMTTVVSPDYRGKGIARLLNEKLEEAAHHQGMDSIFTIVMAGQGMHHVNLKLGYQPILEIGDWYPNGAAAVFMGKKLDAHDPVVVK